MQHKRFFSKTQGILAFTSGGSVDFTPTDFDAPLSERQRSYLYKKIHIDIPQVFWRKQIHGDDILVANKSNVIPAKGPHTGHAQVTSGILNLKGLPDADAYITNEKNLPIAIRTADCVPVFIFDPVHQAIGLAHAGWKGTHKEIAAKTVKKMQTAFGSMPANLKIGLGPSIRKCCYQVGKEFHEYFPTRVKNRDGFLYADVVGANIDQLLKAGVLAQNIDDGGVCTCCDKHFFSYRREGEKAGRMMSLMMLT